MQRSKLGLVAAVAALALGVLAGIASFSGGGASASSPADAATSTPIKHVVVIFDENISFDHYFATYPNATNPAGEPAFTPKAGTPVPNNLQSAGLLSPSNPNSAQPARLDRPTAPTCDQDHTYTDEQKAFNAGAMDKFVQFTGNGTCPGLVMDYYDGNTVTGLWNYAQNYTMSDAFYGTTFGPSTPGALNLVSGNTHGATPNAIAGSVENGTVIGDPNPTGDSCGGGTTITMSGQNIGDLLNLKGVSWGWFQGGFRNCSTATHTNIGGGSVPDYSAHHEPFQYYASTANLLHAPPASVSEIGNAGPANHQYDLSDFNSALAAGNLPAVSFLKAPAAQDAHAGYSDPLDEQHFLAAEINAIQESPAWASTAIVIAYDDSDGWYDHAFVPPVNSSSAAADALNGAGQCGALATPMMGGYQDRCGYGPRLPLLVISPYAKSNTINSTTLDQTSITRFIEDNWSLGRIGDNSFDALAGDMSGMFDFTLQGANLAPRVLIDPTTGAVTSVTRSDQPFPPPTGTTTNTQTTPPPPPPPKHKLTSSHTLSGKKLTVSFKVSTPFTTSASVKIKLTGKRSRVLASVHGTLRKGARSAKLVLHLKTKLTKGTYTITVTLTPHTGAAVSTHSKLHVRH